MSHMPYLKPRKNKRGDTVWMVQVFCGFDSNGKSIMVSRTSPSPRKKDAIKLAEEIKAQHRRGELVTQKSTVASLLDDLLLDYRVNDKSLDWASMIVEKHLRPFFGHLRIDKVDTPLLKQYIATRQEKGRANGTINGELALLRRAFNLGALSTPPKVGRVPHFPMLKVNNARQGFFEHSEYQAMFRALREELRPVLAFAYYTGCRRGEILSLQWPQVDLMEKAVRLEVGTTKNNEARIIPLAPELLDLLTLQKTRRDQYWPDTPWVFYRYADGRQIGDFREAWKRACRSSGLWQGDEKTGRPTRLFHDLRRTGVRNLVRSGAPERVAMAISGHKTRAVFDRYNIVSGRDLQIAAEGLSRYLSAKNQPVVETEISKNLQNGSGVGVVQ
jgi:integrase